MRGNRGIIQNLGILTSGQIIAQLANVAALVFLADFLGAHWFGVVQIGVAFMGYALITAEWGLMALGVREISRLDDPEEVFGFATAHCGVMAIQAAIILALGLILVPRLPFFTHDKWVFILYLFAVIPQIYTQGWIAVGLERMTWVGMARITRSLIYVGLVFLVLRFLPEPGDSGTQRLVPVFFLLAAGLSNLVVNIPLARLFGRVVHPRFPGWGVVRQRWRQSSSIGSNAVVLRVLINIDLVLLGVLATPEVAGNYAAAAKIMFVLVIAVEVLWGALLPRLSRQAGKHRPAFLKSFNLFFGAITGLLAPIALGGWLLAEPIMEFLYRGRFNDGAPIFQVLAISYSMLALSIFLGNTLLAEGRQKWYLIPLLVGSITAVTAIHLWVPGNGGLGAAWGIFLAHGLLLGSLVIINFRNFNRLLLETLLALLPGLITMALVVKFLVAQHVLVQIFCAGAAYLLLASWPLWRLRRQNQLLVATLNTHETS